MRNKACKLCAAAQRLLCCARGASAVEFAVLAPVLLLISFGVAEFARAIWIEQALSSAASYTARCAALSLSNCAASGAYNSSATTSYAQTQAGKWGVTLTSSNIAVSTATSCAGMSGSGAYVQVTLSAPFSTFIASLFPGLVNKTLSGTACFPTPSS